MVLHAGISCYKQKFAIFNTELNKQIIVDSEHVDPTNLNKIFGKMKPYFTAELGCLCICLGSNYDNEIRQKFIETAKNFGFQKIMISDWVSTIYNNLVSKTTLKLQKGDIILIFCGQSCYIWYKGFKKAKFYNEMKYFDLTENLYQIHRTLIKEPALVIYCTKYRTKNVTDVFKYSVIHFYDYLNQVNGCVVKAQIMAGDKNVMEFDAQTLLNRNITVRIGKRIIMEAKKWHPLPLFQKVLKKMPITSHFNVTQKELPNAAKFKVKLEIDKNGIFTVLLNPIFADKNNKNLYPNPFDTLNATHKSDLKFLKDNKNISIPRQFQKHFFLPKKIANNDDRIFAVGIDLGTTRCCAAVNRQSGIETIPLDNSGERLLPSFVGFDEMIVKCGQIVINRLANNSKSTVFDGKRILGKRYSDLKIDENWPFKVLNVNNKIRIQIVGNNSATITKSPEEISAILLKTIKEKVEAFQGKPVSKVVITVPAAFTSYQIKATYAAAKLAGWQNIKLLPEPIAAAFAYFINRPLPQSSTLLLFDLGGGTLDICIFKIINNDIQIISRAGNCNLGGRDFDNVLINYFNAKLKADHNIIVSETKKYKLMLKCQEVKHNLTVIDEDQLDIEDFDISKEGNIRITQRDFEKMSKDLLDNINDSLAAALNHINIKANEIDKVLQVGGACRMPMIKQLLLEKFPEAGHCCEQHPDEVVAVGAAYYSYYLNLQQQNKYC